MRITKSILLSALFVFVLGTVSANNNPNSKTARKEIKELIANANFAKKITKETTLNVTFQVNAKNEIIILSTDNDKYDSSLKSTLNYKKLKSTDMKINKTYTLPIRLTK